MKSRSTASAILRLLCTPALWPQMRATVRTIRQDFFALQQEAVRRPERIRLSRVDCPLDQKIPFVPGYGSLYHDFSPLWIRAAAWLLDQWGQGRTRQAALEAARDLISGVAGIYETAAAVYRRNLSTTPRPRCLRTLPFVMIHLADPHLLCVPSLHVMVVGWTYTKTRSLAHEIADGAPGAEQEAALNRLEERAAAITDSVLLIKQHSVNCISAALYALTRFAPPLFPPQEAAAFTSRLFAATPEIPEESREAARESILARYHTFLSAGESLPPERWADPLLDFLAACPAVSPAQAALFRRGV